MSTMAENGHFSDDISALWGEPAESALVPPRPPPPAADADEPAGPAGNGNGTHNGARPPGAVDDVSRLAEALAVQRSEVVSRAELATVRSELEGAFTHQLAVALYDLLNASSDRFAGVEAHVDERLDSVARRLDRSVQGQADKLSALLESHGAESARRDDEQQRAAEASLEEISARMESFQQDMTALKEAVEELRSAQAEGRRKGRRWGRMV